MSFRITCAACGRVFVREQPVRRFCSVKCPAAPRKHDWKPLTNLPPPEQLASRAGTPYPPLELRPCAWCVTLFSPVDRTNPGIYCSVTCRVAAEHEALVQQG